MPLIFKAGSGCAPSGRWHGTNVRKADCRNGNSQRKCKAGRTRETTSSPRTLGGQSADPERSLVPFLNVDRARLVRRLAGAVSHDDPPRPQCRGRVRPSLTIDRRFEPSSIATRVTVWFLGSSKSSRPDLKEPERYRQDLRVGGASPSCRAQRLECVTSRRWPAGGSRAILMSGTAFCCPMIILVQRGESFGICRLNARAPTAFCFAPRGHTQRARVAGTDWHTRTHTYARTRFALEIFFLHLDVNRVG